MSEEQLNSKLQEKLDYCQQCHLHKNDCRCDATIGFEKTQVQENTNQLKSYDIMVSDWTIMIRGQKKIVKGIIIKDIGLENIIKEEVFLNRVKRELKTPDKFEVLEIKFVKKLGETSNL